MHMCLDCFLETIQKVPLKEKMGDYKGIWQEQSAVPFIINKFMSKWKKPMDSQRIHTYAIDATGLFVPAFHRYIGTFIFFFFFLANSFFFVSVKFLLFLQTQCFEVTNVLDKTHAYIDNKDITFIRECLNNVLCNKQITGTQGTHLFIIFFVHLFLLVYVV